jgi:hypothetical protein
MAKKTARKRETISPKGDKRYVRRDDSGQFEESDNAGKSLGVDRRKKAKHKVASGQGDKGDRPTKKAKKKK